MFNILNEEVFSLNIFLAIFTLFLLIYLFNNLKYFKISLKLVNFDKFYLSLFYLSIVLGISYLLTQELFFLFVINILLIFYFKSKILYTVEDYLYQIILFSISLKYIFKFEDEVFFFLNILIFLHSFLSSGVEKFFDLTWKAGSGFFYFTSLPWISSYEIHKFFCEKVSIILNYYIIFIEIFSLILFIFFDFRLFVFVNLIIFFLLLIFPFRLDMIGFVGFILSFFSIVHLLNIDYPLYELLYEKSYFIGIVIIFFCFFSCIYQIFSIITYGPFKDYQLGYDYFINNKKFAKLEKSKLFLIIEKFYLSIFNKINNFTFKIQCSNLFSTNHFYPLFTYECIFKNEHGEVVHVLPLFSQNGKPLNLTSGIFKSRNLEASLYIFSNISSRFHCLGKTYLNWLNRFFDLVLRITKLDDVSTIHIILNPISFNKPFDRSIVDIQKGFELLSKKVDGFICFTPCKYEFEPLYLDKKNYICCQKITKL